MLRLCLLLLLAKLVFASAVTLVPRINNQENGYQLDPLKDGYMLSIRDPDGKNRREETVKEVSPGELQVKGILHQVFEDRGGSLVVTYEAGRNGYVAKYKYDATSKPTEAPIFAILLSPKLLMSTVG